MSLSRLMGDSSIYHCRPPRSVDLGLQDFGFSPNLLFVPGPFPYRPPLRPPTRTSALLSLLRPTPRPTGTWGPLRPLHSSRPPPPTSFLQGPTYGPTPRARPPLVPSRISSPHWTDLKTKPFQLLSNPSTTLDVPASTVPTSDSPVDPWSDREVASRPNPVFVRLTGGSETDTLEDSLSGVSTGRNGPRADPKDPLLEV